MLTKRLRTHFQSYFDQWIDKRASLQKGDITLNTRSIYIIPTRFGFLFGLVLIAMLIGSINYEMNLGFLLTFLFGATVFTCMFQTYQNFNQINLAAPNTSPAFLGEDIHISTISQSQYTSNNITIQVNNTKTPFNLKQRNECKLKMLSTQRGVHRIKRIKLFSVYPMGLFHIWSWVKTDIQYTVYPKPQALPKNSLDDTHVNISGDQSSSQKGDDELYAYKAYQTGDPINRIAWKKSAQTGKLHSQEMSKNISSNYYIDWHHFENNSQEERLSHMCHLVLQSHNKNESYGLVLPDITIHPEHSEKHKHQCLLALAKFNQPTEVS